MLITKKLRGIFYGWWIVVASFVIFTVVGGAIFYGFTAFFNPIIKEKGWTRSQTSLAFSLRSIEGGLIQPVVGFLVDRIGPRKCIFTGILATVVALLLLSRMNSLSLFYGAFFLLALGGSGAIGIPEYATIANWFRKRRARALGILSAGFGFSGAMTPVLVLLIQAYGWRIAMLFAALLVLVIGIPLSLLVRHRPEQYGYLPDGQTSGSEPHPGDTVRTVGGQLAAVPEEGMSVRQAIRTRIFWVLALLVFFPGFSISAIIVHEMPFLISVGISEHLAGLTMLGITVSSLAGRLVFSWLGDVYDKRRLLAIACGVQAIGVFIFANISTPWMIVPFLLTYGPGYGAQIPLLPAIQADYFGTRAFASLQGLLSLGWMTPGIIAPFLAGWIYDVQGEYYLAFMIFAVLGSLAIPIILSAPVYRKQR